MIRVHVLIGFFLVISTNNMILSSDQPKDRILRTISSSDGIVEECVGSVYIFQPNLENSAWKGANWNACKIIVDPLTEEIQRIETEVDENGKKVTYLLPDENPIFKDIIASVRNKSKSYCSIQ